MKRLPGTSVLVGLGVVLLVAAAAVFGYWQFSGGHFVTQYQVEQTVVEEDEFGEEIERTVMEDEFRFGLMPDKPYDGALVLGGVPGGLAVILLILAALKVRDDSAAGEQ